MLGFRVDDIAHACERLHARGATFERYPHFEQDARGVWRSPSGAQFACSRIPTPTR